MKALIKEQMGVFLRSVHEAPLLDNQVKIKVDYIALDKRDISVADGYSNQNKNIILGHAFSGTVVETRTPNYKLGDLVSVNPQYRLGFMGVDFDGCIRNYVNVPDKQVILNKTNQKTASILEPIAAALSVKDLNIGKNEYVGLYGNNMSTKLIKIILDFYGYNVDVLTDDDLPNLDEECFDYVIETGVYLQKTLDTLLKSLVNKGILIMSTRNKSTLGITPYEMVERELKIKGIKYHDFNASMDWLADNGQLVEPLLGEVYSISQWREAFTAVKKSDDKIVLLTL